MFHSIGEKVNAMGPTLLITPLFKKTHRFFPVNAVAERASDVRRPYPPVQTALRRIGTVYHEALPSDVRLSNKTENKGEGIVVIGFRAARQLYCCC